MAAHLLRVTPNEAIIFTKVENELYGQVQLTNIDFNPVTYKVSSILLAFVRLFMEILFCRSKLRLRRSFVFARLAVSWRKVARKRLM